MIQHFVTINGTIVLIMIDNNSTGSTQELPSKPSPSIPSKGLRVTKRKTKKPPVWETVPIGMVKGRDRTGGSKYSWIKRRPTSAAIKAGQPVGKGYNLIFVHDGQRTNRTYEVIYTSPLDVTKTFKVNIAASSLRALFREVVLSIGNLRATETTENFSLHFQAITHKEGMTEEIMPIPLARELDDRHRPSTDEPVEPITVED